MPHLPDLPTAHPDDCAEGEGLRQGSPFIRASR